MQNRWHTAGIVEVLHQVLTGGHEIDETGHVSAKPVPVIERKVDTKSPRQRKEVNHSIGRAT